MIATSTSLMVDRCDPQRHISSLSATKDISKPRFVASIVDSLNLNDSWFTLTACEIGFV